MKSNGHILWVDDEIHHLKPHILYLKTKGYTVSTATNGHDAEILNEKNKTNPMKKVRILENIKICQSLF